jgi:outer membrane lipoprotein SlyB
MPPSGQYGGNGPYGNGPYGNGPSNNNGPYYGNGPYPNTTQVASSQVPFPSQGSNAAGVPGDAGRVVSIREVAVQGGGGNYGPSQGTFMGGLIGAMGGATIGAITSQTLGGGIIGGVLGMVGGAIAGTIASGNYGYSSARGIEVTVQRDDGQQVTVAQRDDGDIQLGDRVQIVQNRQGVAQVVRDSTRSPD